MSIDSRFDDGDQDMESLRASLEEARREESIDVSDPEGFRAYFEDVIRFGEELLAKRRKSKR